MTLKLAQLLQGGTGNDRQGLMASLTDRERQILAHLARGESNKTIARALDGRVVLVVGAVYLASGLWELAK